MKRNFPRTSGISGTRRRVLVGGSLLGASQIIRFGTRAAYIVLLARYLGPEAFGLFNYGVAWYLAFLSLTYLGFDLIISRDAWQDDVRSKELLAATLRILLLVTAVAALLSLGLAVFTERGEPAFILVLFSLALVGRAVAVWVSFVLIAQNRSGRVLLLEGSCRVGEVLIGSAALILGADLMGVVAIHAGFWWVQAVFGLRQIKIADLLRTPMGLRDGLILLGAKPFILGLAGIFQVWIAQGPIILFHLLGGDDASLGAIAVAFQIFGVIAGVSWAATRALLPDLSRNVRGGGVADETVLRLLVPGILLSTAVLTAGAVIFAFPLITALFGSRYTDISAFVPVAVAASGAYMIAVCGHQILSAHLKDGAIVLGTFGGAMAATIVMVVMWQHGPQFAPFASLSAGVLVWMLTIVASLRSVTRFSVIRVFLGPFLAGGMGVLAATFLEASGPVVAAVGSLLAIAVSAAMMHLWKGSPAD